MIAMMTDKKPVSNFLKLITPDLQEHGMPDLATEEGRDMLEAYIQDYDSIVIDNISCLFRSGGENEAESWQEAQEWALNLRRRRGKSVLFVHHAGKSGVQRATSKEEDLQKLLNNIKPA